MRLVKIWDSVRSSFWFVPSLMAVAATALAFGGVALDESLGEAWVERGWVYAGGPEGARAVLSVVAGSMVTVAGVVFSITIVALSLASSQFGQRLLRNFMRDAANQVVLGAFTATFLYCLLVLRTVRTVDEDPFVPHLSVTLGVLLAVADLGVLIYFIHHVAVSIRVGHVIADVATDLRAALDRLFPGDVAGAGDRPREDAPPREEAMSAGDSSDGGTAIVAEASGYVQRIDEQAIVAAAAEHEAFLNLRCRAGRFVVEGTPLAVVRGGRATDPGLARAVRAAFVLGTERTSAQDPEFAVDQLVEIAVRALSPGINDPFTAVNCLDALAAELCRVAGRRSLSPILCDDGGRPRAATEAVRFGDVVDASFRQIRQAARGNAAVSIRLLEVLALLAERVRTAPDRVVVGRHAEAMWDACREALPDESDRRDAAERYEAVRAKLAGPVAR